MPVVASEGWSVFWLASVSEIARHSGLLLSGYFPLPIRIFQRVTDHCAGVPGTGNSLLRCCVFSLWFLASLISVVENFRAAC